MQERKMNLYEKIQKTVSEKYPEYSNLKFLTDDSNSAEFINNLVKADGVYLPVSEDRKNYIAETRARHSAVSFLLGLELVDSCSFNVKIKKAFVDEYGEKKYDSLWQY